MESGRTFTLAGTVGVRQGLNNNEFMYLATKPSISKSETHAALVTTTKLFKDFDLTAKVMTQKQLRQNYPPNNWKLLGLCGVGQIIITNIASTLKK